MSSQWEPGPCTNRRWSVLLWQWSYAGFSVEGLFSLSGGGDRLGGAYGGLFHQAEAGSGLGTGKNWINTPPQFFAHVAAGHFGADTNKGSTFALKFQNSVAISSLAQFAANFGQQRPGDFVGTYVWTAKYSRTVGFLYGTGDPTPYVTLVAYRLGTFDRFGRPEYMAKSLYPGR